MALLLKRGAFEVNPFTPGYFELFCRGTIGQAWVTVIAGAISLTALFCFEKPNAVIAPISPPIIKMAAGSPAGTCLRLDGSRREKPIAASRHADCVDQTV